MSTKIRTSANISDILLGADDQLVKYDASHSSSPFLGTRTKTVLVDESAGEGRHRYFIVDVYEIKTLDQLEDFTSLQEEWERDGVLPWSEARRIEQAEAEFEPWFDRHEGDDHACEKKATEISKKYDVAWTWSNWGGIEFLSPAEDEEVVPMHPDIQAFLDRPWADPVEQEEEAKRLAKEHGLIFTLDEGGAYIFVSPLGSPS